jgi:hypothetical protein
MQRDETMRPSLDFQHAYDYCAGNVQPSSVLLLAEHPVHAYELGRRLSDYRINDFQKTSSVNTVIWVTPQTAHALDQICDVLLPSGELFVMTANPLARRLPEWKGACSLSSLAVIRSLRKQHFTIRRVQGFHSVTSILWGYLALGFRKLGRYALADRCWYAMRASFAVNGWQAHLAPVIVIRAVK